ncbi:hypothetical protein STEG23_035809, partial [Scotinomys teguina]
DVTEKNSCGIWVVENTLYAHWETPRVTYSVTYPVLSHILTVFSLKDPKSHPPPQSQPANVSPGCPGTLFVNQACFELSEIYLPLPLEYSTTTGVPHHDWSTPPRLEYPATTGVPRHDWSTPPRLEYPPRLESLYSTTEYSGVPHHDWSTPPRLECPATTGVPRHDWSAPPRLEYPATTGVPHHDFFFCFVCLFVFF